MTQHGTAGGRAPRGRGRSPRLTRRPVTLLLALVFFFGPLAAFALGARPEKIENRPLTELPSASDGWSFFPDFTAWATDHLPLRGDAVRGNAALSEAVFGEPPVYGRPDDGGEPAGIPSGDQTGEQDTGAPENFPRVIAGKDGWLYFGDDMSNPCQPERTVPE